MLGSYSCLFATKYRTIWTLKWCILLWTFSSSLNIFWCILWAKPWYFCFWEFLHCLSFLVDLVLDCIANRLQPYIAGYLVVYFVWNLCSILQAKPPYKCIDIAGNCKSFLVLYLTNLVSWFSWTITLATFAQTPGMFWPYFVWYIAGHFASLLEQFCCYCEIFLVAILDKLLDYFCKLLLLDTYWKLAG